MGDRCSMTIKCKCADYDRVLKEYFPTIESKSRGAVVASIDEANYGYAHECQRWAEDGIVFTASFGAGSCYGAGVCVSDGIQFKTRSVNAEGSLIVGVDDSGKVDAIGLALVRQFLEFRKKVKGILDEAVAQANQGELNRKMVPNV